MSRNKKIINDDSNDEIKSLGEDKIKEPTEYFLDSFTKKDFLTTLPISEKITSNEGDYYHLVTLIDGKENKYSPVGKIVISNPGHLFFLTNTPPKFKHVKITLYIYKLSEDNIVFISNRSCVKSIKFDSIGKGTTFIINSNVSNVILSGDNNIVDSSINSTVILRNCRINDSRIVSRVNCSEHVFFHNVRMKNSFIHSINISLANINISNSRLTDLNELIINNPDNNNMAYYNHLKFTLKDEELYIHHPSQFISIIENTTQTQILFSSVKATGVYDLYISITDITRRTITAIKSFKEITVDKLKYQSKDELCDLLGYEKNDIANGVNPMDGYGIDKSHANFQTLDVSALQALLISRLTLLKTRDQLIKRGIY